MLNEDQLRDDQLYAEGKREKRALCGAVKAPGKPTPMEDEICLKKSVKSVPIELGHFVNLEFRTNKSEGTSTSGLRQLSKNELIAGAHYKPCLWQSQPLHVL